MAHTRTHAHTQIHTHSHTNASTADYRDGFGLSLISLYSEGLVADNPIWTVQIVDANSNSDTHTLQADLGFQMHGIEARLGEEKKTPKKTYGAMKTQFVLRLTLGPHSSTEKTYVLTLLCFAALQMAVFSQRTLSV